MVYAIFFFKNKLSAQADRGVLNLSEEKWSMLNSEQGVRYGERKKRFCLHFIVYTELQVHLSHVKNVA